MMEIIDFFRGSKNERNAKRLIEEVRTLGETRRAEYDAREALIYLLKADWPLTKAVR